MIVDKAGQPGDVYLFSVSVNGKDVSDAVMSLRIHQTIFSPFWVSYIDFNDTNNLLLTVGLKTDDDVSIEIETKNGSEVDGKEKFQFKIVKIYDRQFQNEGQQTFSIECVDQCFLTNNRTRVIKSYIDMPEQIIVKDLTQRLGGKLDKFDTGKNVSWISTNIAPLIGIHHMSLSQGSDYLFYQVDKAKFNWKSFKKLKRESEVGKYVMAVSNYGGPEQKTHPMMTFRTYLISDQDLITAELGGYVGSGLRQINFLEKFLLNPDSGSYPGLNLGFYGQHPKQFDQGTSVPEGASGWFSQRKQGFKAMEDKRIIIQTFGAGKMKDWVGKTMKIEVPTQKDDKIDRSISGKYIIGAITQLWGRHSFVANIELIKAE